MLKTFVVIVVLTLSMLGVGLVSTAGTSAPASDFAGGTKWLNTPGEGPLTLAALRGKVVLVEFWTAG
jgi:hypothetical protein